MTDDTELLYATPRTPQRQAYVEGLAAAAAGKGWQDNPYPSAGVVDLWRIWESGYKAWHKMHPAVSTEWANPCIQSGVRAR